MGHQPGAWFEKPTPLLYMTLHFKKIGGRPITFTL
jgi:hypothetical protein